MYRLSFYLAFAVSVVTLHHAAEAQGTATDYQRAADLIHRYRDKVVQSQLRPIWLKERDAFWYCQEQISNTVNWLRVDASSGNQEAAFDHEKLASALADATGSDVDAEQLRFTRLRVDAHWIEFSFARKRWQYFNRSNRLEEIIEAFGHAGGARGSHPRSLDGKWHADAIDNQVVLRAVGEDRMLTDDPPIQLSKNVATSQGYIDQFFWAEDSKCLVAIYRIEGDKRQVTVIDSTPDNQLQPITQHYHYLKPGDQVPIHRPHLFDIESRQQIEIETALAPNPYQITGIRWKKDSSAFTYEYNPRGHQGYRVIEVDAETGESRIVIDEQNDTFFCYSSKKYLHYLDESDEIIWMSERDGWNHLYLYDWTTGEVKRQITQGEWVVREVDRVDEEARQIWFWAGGIHPDQDPYYRHYCRVNMDTGEVTVLTASNGDHTDLSISPNGKYLVTSWSRVDHPPVHELRNAETGELIREIARADASALMDAGWVAPAPFSAKGRDGETDIYGYIIRPTNFDPTKKYPVIEYIYAGPHDQHVEKRFYEYMRVMSLAELGFIVVRIDGMGTNWRSKAFHDVCWKNLKDAGFPDRIAWMKAAAQTRPWMDIDRVGIFGGSAGGQNAMRAVLDHADFYKAAAADCGCHDNRMDKIWWNEQWMGWPVDASYEQSSNVVDAHKLDGALLLTVGELDRNVDPASTMQVVDALIEADKDFELIVFPGKGHGAGSSPYGTRRMYDFFVRELYGNEPRAE